jgi:hypothetical protein
LGYTAKGAKLAEDVAAASRAATVFKTGGRIFGVAGAVFTGISDATSSHGWTWGTTAKVGISLLTTFTPYGWVYGVIDLGVGLTTGKTLTDRIGSAIDNAGN